MFYEGNGQAKEVDRVEALRLILEREQHRPVTYEEALEVGESLISFYEALGAQMDDSDQLQGTV